MTKQELEMCINEYGKDIYSFCKHLTNNPPEADDLHLCISEGMFYNIEAYCYDKLTGKIRRNEKYKGLNALFDRHVKKIDGGCFERKPTWEIAA